jgi:hypothetical protein
MIRYALACEAGHAFESWFRDSDAFDAQAARGLVACPVCGSAKVGKSVMAPAVARTDKLAPVRSPAPEAPAQAASAQMALLDERQTKLREMARALHAEIAAKTEDVGARFPQEARAMHEGEAPHRPIRGEASLSEARALIEDGVPILPVPSLPEDRH